MSYLTGFLRLFFFHQDWADLSWSFFFEVDFKICCIVKLTENNKYNILSIFSSYNFITNLLKGTNCFLPWLSLSLSWSLSSTLSSSSLPALGLSSSLHLQRGAILKTNHHHYMMRSDVSPSTCNLRTPGVLVTMTWPLEDHLDPDHDHDLQTTEGSGPRTPERGGHWGRAEALMMDMMTTWLMGMRQYVYTLYAGHFHCWSLFASLLMSVSHSVLRFGPSCVLVRISLYYWWPVLWNIDLTLTSCSVAWFLTTAVRLSDCHGSKFLWSLMLACDWWLAPLSWALIGSSETLPDMRSGILRSRPPETLTQVDAVLKHKYWTNEYTVLLINSDFLGHLKFIHALNLVVAEEL